MLQIRLLFAILLTVTTIEEVRGQVHAVRTPVRDITDSLAINRTKQLIYWGKNKVVPASYEPQVLYALSYFPELKDLRILFKITTSKHDIISTRPTVGSLFRRSAKRKYVVFMSDSIAGRTIPAFSKAPANGQVGILGHEFCHIVYFNKRSGLALFGLAIAHLSKTFMDRFERNTDIADIERGLGYQLIDWKMYLRKRFNSTSAALKSSTPPKKTSRYLSPEEVQTMMRSM